MSSQLMTGPMTAQGQIAAGKMTAETLRNQATNLDQQSQEAEQKGQYDAMREQIVSGQRIGTSVAAFGANGVEANSGSALDVVGASHMNAELDRMNILHGADIRAINYQNQASMDRFGAESAIRGAYWAALGSVMGAGTSGISDKTAAKPKGNEADSGDGPIGEDQNASAEAGGEGADGAAGGGAGGEAGASEAAALA